MGDSSLLGYTNKLVNYIEESYLRFQQLLEDETIEYDFFEDVKPYADQVKEVADKWKMTADIWIKEEKPKYLHASQIETTYDHILNMSVGSFYRYTKRKRFKNTYQSILYVLNQIVDQNK
ncbi:YppE family protein [Bacillus sp. PS06]|uniref:YppE family protein n=1 Tax=Bacillus sp. PS06 TaxID=2764176 RepID=UPI001784E0F6|nr:YppE family protein [Bacillus sp. PS06]MBD8070205.1 YppE family protein [Bacillus sp. PS06]